MRDTLSFLSEKRRANFRLRWIGLALLTAAALVSRLYVTFDLSALLVLAGLFVVELLTVQMLHVRLEPRTADPYARRLLELTAQLQIVAELALVSWWVYLTGGVTSPFLPLYLIYIFSDGASSSTRDLAIHAVIAIGMLALVVLGTYYGFLEHADIGMIPESLMWQDAGYVAATLIVFAALMAVTLVVAVNFSRRTSDREIELARSAERMAVQVEQLNKLRSIGQRLAATLDLAQVLDAVGESALKMVGATDVHIFLYDPAARQFSPGVGVWSDGHRGTVVQLPRPDGFTARVATTSLPLIINDAEQNPLFASAQARSWKLQAIAGFPIIKSDRVIAVLNAAFLEPHHFTADQEQAMLLLADQAAIAIDNALLYQQVQKKIQELSAVNQVTQVSAQLTDLTTLLNNALEAILGVLSAHAALVAMLNPKGELELAAHRGLSHLALTEFRAHPLRVGEGFGGQVIQTGTPLFVADAAQYSREHRRTSLEIYASVYTVALRVQDRNIGVLQLLWTSPHQLTPTEASLCSAIAPQLAIALRNASLYSETIRRADELATLRSIGLATTSTLNLREQLRLLYENVNQLLRVDAFFVGLYDQVREELRLEFIVEEGWFLRPIQYPLSQTGLSRWVIENLKPLLLDDLQHADGLPAKPQHFSKPARSWLGVPLLLKDRVMGLISVQSFQPAAFTLSDERFLVAVAQHVALALDNARLFDDSVRRTRELTLLNEISRTISSSLDLDVVLERTARALSDQLGYRYVSIYSLEGGRLVCRAAIGDTGPIGGTWELESGIIGQVARTGRAVFVPDVKADRTYVMAHEDTVCEICVPIVRDKVLGIINLEETQLGALKEDDLALLNVLSEQLAIAETNASLYREALGRERFATRLGQLGMTISATLDLTQLIETLCRESLVLFSVDTAAIYLREGRRGEGTETTALAYGARGRGDYSYAPSGGLGAGPPRLVCRAAAGWGRDALLGTIAGLEDVGSILAYAVRMARGSILHDARASTQLDGAVREAMHVHACLVIPILKERDAIGVLLLSDRQDPARFGEPELARAAIVASQAGLAISNAQLYQAAQRRVQEQSSLYEIALAVSSTLDLREQLRIIYAQIIKHFQLTGFDIALRGENDTLEFALFVDRGRQLEPFSSPLDDAGFAGWVVRNRRTLVIDDIAAQWDSLPVKPGEYGAPAETASYFGIPLISKSEAIGAMALQRFPVEPFTLDEQRFLSALAQQVAFAVDNARLHQQSERNSAQQALLYQASRRIAGALNLETLLNGIATALGQDFGFSSVVVMLADEASRELRPAAGSPKVLSRLTLAYRHPFGVGLVGRAAESGATQLANNTALEPNHRSFANVNSLSEVAVPIKSGERVLGVLDIQGTKPNAFDGKDVRMFEAIADQLAIAMENAKLYASAQERLARINALQNIEVAILSTMNLSDRFDLILEYAVTQMRVDLGVIFMRELGSRDLVAVRQRGVLEPAGAHETRYKPGEGAVGWIMERGEPLYIPNVSQDSRWSYRVHTSPAIASYLGMPLKIQERTIGVIDVATRAPRVFADEEIAFFKTLASHAAVAIENARLYEQTRAQLEQLRSTHDRLVETERRAAIGELVAGLAHEVNNPLTAIVGHSQLLLETLPSGAQSEQWREELETISTAAQRIARIVQEFVKLSHVEGGHAESVNLSDLVSQAVLKFENRPDAQDVAVLLMLPPEPLWVNANPVLMEQVLQNILLNSLEAMPHGGRIDVTAGLREGSRIYCSIKDSGDGIPTADLKRVFEPGYTTKVESGTVRGIGLGLYTAERIIKSHGGAIEVDSREGEYTLVTFTLPGHARGAADDGG